MPLANPGIPNIEQNYLVPITAGRTTAVTGLGTGSTQVAAVDPQRRSITFHNPNNTSAAVLFVCQAQDASGNAISAAVDGAGCFTIFPGSSQTFLGNVGGAWNACASVAAQNLTVITDN